MNQSQAHSAVRNVFFSGVRLAIGTLATICTSAMMARTLGPSNAGLYSYAMWLVGTLGVLANVGLPIALTKYISEYMGRGDSVTAAQLARRLLLTQLWVAAGVSGLVLCFVVLKTPYRAIVPVVSGMILIQALQQALLAALAGIQRFDRAAELSLYSALAQVGAVGVATLLHSGVLGMLMATVIGLLIGTCAAYPSVHSLLLKKASGQSSLTVDSADLRSQIKKFCFTISYILLLDSIVWQRSEVLFLKWFSTLPEIAFYTLAYSIVAKMNDVASIFSGTLLPLYSEAFGRNGLQDMSLVYRNSLKYLQMAMVPLCALGLVVARPLVELLYGSRYLPLVAPLQILIVSLGFTSIGVVGSPLLVGIGKQNFNAIYGTFVAVLNITVDFLLIPHHGALGAAIANCSAQIIGVFGGTIYIIRCAKVRFPWKTTATIYGAAVVAAAPVLYTLYRLQAGLWAQVISVALGATLYVVLLLLSGQVGKNDLRTLKGAFVAKVMPKDTVEVNSVV